MNFALRPRTAVCLVFIAAIFMSIMDSTVIQVAIPTLARDFSVPVTGVSGVVTSYLVTLAVIMPACGWLGDRFGTKPVLLTALTVFTAASALCGLATSLPELVAFRALQGLGGGALVPVGMAMVYHAFPPAERIRATRLVMVPALIAPTVGPPLGGLLVDGASWRWIFYLNVPIGALVVAFGIFALRAGPVSPARRIRFDLPGFLLAGTGFPLLMYALSESATSGLSSARVLGAGLGGLALLAVFVQVELRTREPMLRLRIIGNRMFRVANTQAAFASAGFLGILFLVPVFLQNALGYSALHSGMTTFWEALGGMTGIQISSRIYRRVGPRRLMASGQLLTAATIAAMIGATAADTGWLMPVLMYVTGTGIGFASAPAQTAALASISTAQTVQATTLYNTQRQAGAAAGVALLAAVLAALQPAQGLPKLGAYHVAFAVAAALMACACAFSFRIRDSEAAATMAPQPVAETV